MRYASKIARPLARSSLALVYLFVPKRDKVGGRGVLRKKEEEWVSEDG
jgi:hypothetical protein